MNYTYGDLFQFETLESVIQLKDADELAEARQLVQTYVVSEEMADRLINLVLPQLQYDQPTDNKGLFVVGNYGTGKSHLMSVLSAVAEHAELAGEVNNTRVRTALTSIAGRFKVTRTEIGTVKRTLYEVLADDISAKLSQLGLTFTFPPTTRLINYKEALGALMSCFHEAFPDQGLLIVVDELLEFLQSRTDHELIVDLGFLRELGEFCRDSRLRFIAGIQETLFDNPKFSFVSDSVRRVKDRFEQLLIVRRDVKFVVAERLLKKSADQLQKIRDYLTPFAPFYSHMNEQLDEYARLFPVHPDYIDTLERIIVIEKREILKTISLEMKQLLDRPLPTDRPGFLTYRHYWQYLRQNQTYRANPEIRAVIDCSEVLESRVNLAFTRPAYRPMALEIIQGLSVQRLTTGDIYAPLGVTPEELRDGLALFQPGLAGLGGVPAEDLLTQVEVVLREILKTVNGQFISYNAQNRQYYLDLKKTEDYEALIERKAETLDKRYLDRYYFEALKVVMDATALPTVITGYRIWQHELEWRERRVTRQGYLFFGAPSERSTAQPPRDFYLYFLPPFEGKTPGDDRKPDEVFFRLAQYDEAFQTALLKYAAALELSLSASGAAKRTYEDKAKGFLAAVTGWLQDNLARSYNVIYAGHSRPLIEWVKLGKLNLARLGVRDIINAVSSLALAGYFEDSAPQYPVFPSLITTDTRPGQAEQALRWLRGNKTAAGSAILDALQLLDGDRLDPARSPYAAEIVSRLANKSAGQVLNRNELVYRLENGLDYLAPDRFRLEPEWVVVLLATLVYNGDVVLAIPGKKFDAGNLEGLAATPLAELLNFKHLEKPRDWNLPALRALCELLGIEPGRAQLLAHGQDQDSFVQAVQSAVQRLIGRVVRAQQRVSEGLPVWNVRLLASRQTDYRQRLESLKAFLEGLQVYTSPARFKNFRLEPGEISAQTPNLATLDEIEGLANLVADLLPLASYISQAETLLPPQHPLVNDLRVTRTEVLLDLENPARRSTSGFRQHALNRLQKVKRDYIQAYAELHTRSRRGRADDRAWKQLHDARLRDLELLRAIPLLAGRQLDAFKAELDRVVECTALTEMDLEVEPLCPHCRFQPVTQLLAAPVAEVLEGLDARLNRLVEEWTASLLTSLAAESLQNDLKLVKPAYGRLLRDFLAERRLPAELGPDFVEAIREVLSGLERLTVWPDQLLAALQKGGSPLTRTELESRFRQYVEELFRYKNSERIRLVIETENKE